MLSEGDRIISFPLPWNANRLKREVTSHFAGNRLCVIANRERSRFPIGFIQDYHFAALPRMIREKVPHATLVLFWHIPWPTPEKAAICPWIREILHGMMGADFLGFQTEQHCDNFLDSVDQFLGFRAMDEYTCRAQSFPISVEWPPKYEVPAAEIPKIRSMLLEECGLPSDSKIAVGVDRMDYTKGILEKFRVVDTLLTNHPELIGKFFLIQISAPTRERIECYRRLASELTELSEHINRKYAKSGYRPILHRPFYHDSARVTRLLQSADVCLVTSLHAGMNLVAKEFVASRSDNRGALVLSRFTGAAGELSSAYLVNPYNAEACARSLHRALLADEEEKTRRMKEMRKVVKSQNVFSWAGELLETTSEIWRERKHDVGFGHGVAHFDAPAKSKTAPLLQSFAP